MIARISAANEALLKEMHDKPGNINVSTTRTSTQTLFFISALLEKADRLPHLANFDPVVLAVDDEEISRRAVAFSIEKAGVRAVICPMMRQGVWFTKNGHTVDYAWDEKEIGRAHV